MQIYRLNSMVFGLLADYQYLGNAKDSDNEDGFNTPLASLHEFQGYADAFLTTTNGSGCGIVANKNGLIDMNLSLFYSHNIWGVILLTYHDFNSIDEYTDAAVGGDMTNDLGTEIDFKYTLNIPKTKNLELLVKGAFYKGGEAVFHSEDITKYWVGLSYNFSTKTKSAINWSLKLNNFVIKRR